VTALVSGSDLHQVRIDEIIVEVEGPAAAVERIRQVIAESGRPPRWS
jgi:hypothetical protein